MQKRCCRLAWTEQKKLVTDTNRPAKRWLGALSAAPRSGEISPKNYRPCPEYQSRHHCDENERPAPSGCRGRGAASGRWRRASKPVLSHILSLAAPRLLRVLLEVPVAATAVVSTFFGSESPTAQPDMADVRNC